MLALSAGGRQLGDLLATLRGVPCMFNVNQSPPSGLETPVSQMANLVKWRRHRRPLI